MDRNDLKHWLKTGHLTIPKMFLDYYHLLGLSESELVLLLQLFRKMDEGENFPTPDELAKSMGVETKKCAERLRELVKRGFIAIEENEDENGVRSEIYSLDPFYDQLLTLSFQETDAEENNDADRELMERFEREFSRPLSPMECETIVMWLEQDKYSPQLIHAALRESVISGKLNLRYMDRILFEWQKNGIRTPDEAKQYGERFRSHQKQRRKRQDTQEITYPNFNWLEDN